MSNEDANSQDKQTGPLLDRPVQTGKRSRGAMILGGSALVGMLLVGAVAGAVATKVAGRDERQALLPPVAISAMKDDSLVAVKGKVVEMFGNKFIVSDSSGRALIDTGPAGDGNALVAQNEDVTIQGRFDDGFVHAGMVIHTDGRVDELTPPHRKGPPHGGPDFGPRHGDGGPDRENALPKP